MQQKRKSEEGKIGARAISAVFKNVTVSVGKIEDLKLVSQNSVANEDITNYILDLSKQLEKQNEDFERA